MENAKPEKTNPTARIPILITSSITPHDTAVKLADPEQRLFHAIESISQWIRVAPASRFVLCDGSSFDFRPIVRELFPTTEIESLFFDNDPVKIRAYGRGYGEGEIVKFALKHSAYLREAEIFAKCSSKLWVENYADCLKEWRDNCLFSGVFKNVFSIRKLIEMVQVDTRFYIVNSDFYLKNFIDVHQHIGKAPGFGLEDSFFQKLQAIHPYNYLFSVQPVIRGVGGGTGKYYKDSWLRIVKEYLKLKIIKKTRIFRHLFNPRV